MYIFIVVQDLFFKERGVCVCVDVTMALLYSFNPCQAWALRKSALVFVWLSSRA